MNAGRLHRLKKRNRASDVVAVIRKRLLGRLAHSLEGSKMQNSFDLGMLFEYFFQGCEIARISFQRERIPLRQLPHPLEGHGRRIGIIIQGYHFMSGLEQNHSGMTANVPCSSRN